MKIILLIALLLIMSTPLSLPQNRRLSIDFIKTVILSPTKTLENLSQQYEIPLNLIHAIWEQESNKAIRSQRGKAGEYGPFQILNIAAKQVNCKGAWRSTFSKNAECGVKYLKHASNRCGNFYNHKIATFYNTGKCRKKPNGYSQQVMKRMLKV